MDEYHYYPFGAIQKGNGTSSSLDYVYRYNNKELNTDFGLDWMDYGARWRNVWNPVWVSVDPLAEEYYSWSPYNYVMNNPIEFIDPNGKFVAEPPINGLAFFGDDTGIYYWNEENNNYDHTYVDGNGNLVQGQYSADEFKEPQGQWTIEFSLDDNATADKFTIDHTIQDLAGALMAFLAEDKKPLNDISNPSKYPGVKIYSHPDMNGAITLDNMIFTNPNMQGARTLDHEYGHYLDFKHHFKYNQKAYLKEIGIPSFWSATKATVSSHKHHDSPSEKRADILGAAWSKNIRLYPNLMK